jgi:RNA polymerase sigma-70 factor (ECF subfamily)
MSGESSVTERSNEEWVAALSQPGPLRDAALDDLRARLLRGLGYALSRSGKVDDALLEDFAQDALLRILDGLDTFRGEARFTTWAQKIAMRVAYTELRRHRYRDFSLEGMMGFPDNEFVPDFMTDPDAGPEQRAVQSSVLAAMQRVINEELTDKQRQALVAVKIQGVPLAEVARRMDSNRNAMYKLMHDARQKLKDALLEEGLTPEQILSAFEA